MSRPSVRRELNQAIAFCFATGLVTLVIVAGAAESAVNIASGNIATIRGEQVARDTGRLSTELSQRCSDGVTARFSAGVRQLHYRSDRAVRRVYDRVRLDDRCKGTRRAGFILSD